MTNKVVSFTKKSNGFNRNHRKENHFYQEYLVISPELKQVISCRMYGTGRMNYCAIWIYANEHASGTGSAGGYGYHRESAACSEAILKAGYKLEKDISGVGESAIESALLAIAEHHGHTGCKIFTSHG